MYTFKRIIAALDLTSTDEQVIRYTAMLARKCQADQIYFIHVADSLALPEELAEKYPDILAPVDETLEAQMKDKVNRFFELPEGCDVDILVREGNATEALLKWATYKEVDLMVMGKKPTHKGSGTLPARLAKVSHCSLIFVPEDAPIQINRLLVPTDFSKNAAMALKQAGVLAKETGATISCLHIYELPLGFYKSGKSAEEFAAIMEENAHRAFQQHLQRNSIDLTIPECIMRLDDDNTAQDIINEVAKAQGADMVVMGSKGRTALAALLLGSLAAKMVDKRFNVPTLIVKDKKHNLSFLEALLRI